MINAMLGLQTAASIVNLASPHPTDLTAGRAWAFLGMGLAVAGLVAGATALAQSRRRAAGRRRVGAAIAVVTGSVGAAIGVYVLAAAEGGPNTGYGVVGGFVALIAGLAAAGLGALAMVRNSRRAHADAT